MADMSASLDASDFKSGIAQIAAACQQGQNAIQDFVLKFVEFNQKGQLKLAVVTGFDEFGNKVEKTFERTLAKVNTVFKQTSERFTQNRDNLKALADQYKRAAEAADLLNAKTAASAISGSFDQTNVGAAGTARQAQLRAGQGALVRAIAGSGLGVSDVQAILDRINQGFVDIETGARGRVQAALLQLKRAYEGIDESASKAADKQKRALVDQATDAEKQARQQQLPQIEQTLRSAFPVPPDASIAKLQRYEAAIQSILRRFAAGKLTLQQFTDLVAKVSADPRSPISNLSPDESRTRASLVTLKTLFDETGQAGKNAGGLILISWAGVLRLFEALVLRDIFRSLIQGFTASIRTFEDFSIKVGQVRAITQDASLSTADWTAKLRALSNEFGLPLVDTASTALELLRSRLVNGANATEFLRKGLQFSAATGLDSKQSIELLSDSLRVFGLHAGEVDRAVGVLFTTVDKGGASADQLQHGIGRLGSDAVAVGVKFEEVAAAVSALTSKGVKTSDALYLVQSVLNKLVNPSEQMKELFKEIGVSSGESAVGLLGFGGVLQLLGKEIDKGGVSRLQDLVKDFKAFRGAANLQGPAFGDFSDQLSKVTENLQRFESAQQIVAETAGTKIKRAFQEVKNVATLDLIGGFVEKVSGPLGGLVGLFEKLIGVVKLAINVAIAYGVAFATVKIATLAAGAAAAAANVPIGLLATNLVLGIGSARNLGTSLLGLIATYKALAAQAIITGAVLLTTLNADTPKERALTSLESAASERRQALQATELEKFNRNLDRERAAFEKSYGDRFRVVLKYLADTRSVFSKFQDTLFEKHDPVTDRLRKGNEDVIKSLEDLHRKLAIDKEDLNKIETDAASKIKASQKEARGIRDKAEVKNFQEELKDRISNTVGSAGGVQPLGLNIAEVGAVVQFAERLKGQAIKLFNNDEIEEARKKLEEIDKLLQNLLDKQLSFREKAAKLGVVFTTPATGPSSEIGGRVLDNQNLRLKFEERYQRNQKARYDNAINSERLLIQLQQEALRVEQARDALQSRFKEAQDKQRTSASGFLSNTEEFNKQLKRLDEFRIASEPSAGGGFLGFGDGFLGLGVHGPFGAELSRLRAEVQTEFKKLNELNQKFSRDPNKTVADFDAVKAQAARAVDSLAKYNLERQGENANKFQIGGVSLFDIATDVQRTGVNARRSLSGIFESRKELRDLESQGGDINRVIDTLPEKYRNLGQAAQDAGELQKRSIQDVAAELDRAIQKVNELQRAFEKSKQFKPIGAPTSAIEGLDFGTSVAFTPRSSPSAGSFALEAGSSSSTVVGDINITMNSTGDAQADVRQIAAALRREIRRGNVDLT